ncbi:MAG: hypothetical protein PVF43_14725, partial [Candidatus Eiseniibacteriota bacterium]
MMLRTAPGAPTRPAGSMLRATWPLVGLLMALACLTAPPAVGQDEDVEPITSADCAGCHETSE